MNTEQREFHVGDRHYVARDTGTPYELKKQTYSSDLIEVGGILVVRLDGFKSYVGHFRDWDTVEAFIKSISKSSLDKS